MGALLAHCLAWANPLAVDQSSATRTEAVLPAPDEPSDSAGDEWTNDGAEHDAPEAELLGPAANDSPEEHTNGHEASAGDAEGRADAPEDDAARHDTAEGDADDDGEHHATPDGKDDELLLEPVRAPAPAKLYADPPPPELEGVYMGTTRYTRTGLHLRANVGAGYLHIFNSSAANLEDQPDFSVENSSVSAVPTHVELWLGGGLRRDLALNLVVRFGHASGGRLRSGTHELELQGGLSTAFLGAGLLYHLDPAHGWLVGLVAGFERWQASFERNTAPQVGGSGIVASLLGGHDWWIGADTAFGILTKLDVGAATGNGRAEVGELQLENSDIDFYLQAGVAISLSYF